MDTLFNRYVVTTALLVLAAAALLTLDLTGRLEARSLLVGAAAPAYRASTYLNELRYGEADRAVMAERLARRSLEAGRAEDRRRENEALRAAAGLEVLLPYELVPARVVERKPDAWLKTVAIDAGRRDGVEVGMPVIGTEGLVGRVTRVTAGAAEVELISSERLRIAATHAPTGEKAVYYADASGRGHLQYLPRTTAVALDDLVITASESGLFPPGLIIGRVGKYRRPFDSMFADVTVAPAENLNALQDVFVVRWRPAAGAAPRAR